MFIECALLKNLGCPCLMEELARIPRRHAATTDALQIYPTMELKWSQSNKLKISLTAICLQARSFHNAIRDTMSLSAPHYV